MFATLCIPCVSQFSKVCIPFVPQKEDCVSLTTRSRSNSKSGLSMASAVGGLPSHDSHAHGPTLSIPGPRFMFLSPLFPGLTQERIANYVFEGIVPVCSAIGPLACAAQCKIVHGLTASKVRRLRDGLICRASRKC